MPKPAKQKRQAYKSFAVKSGLVGYLEKCLLEGRQPGQQKAICERFGVKDSTVNLFNC